MTIEKSVKVYRKLRLNRVDFVNAGANPGAHITLAKRAPTEERRMAEDTNAEAVAKRLADAELETVALKKALAESEAKAKETSEVVAKMVADAAKANALTVAKGFDKLPGTVEETANLLFIAKRKFEDAEYAAFETVLRAANEQIKASKLFSVAGSDEAGEAASDFDKLVHKRMTENSEPQHTAMAAVLKTVEGKAAYSVLRGN